MFRKQASLPPDSSCHWPKGGRAREGRRDREREGRKEKGGGRRGRMGEKDGERGDIQIRNDISLSTSRCNHRFTSLKWVSGASLSLQSNLPSPTPTDVFNVKLIIK